MSCSDVLQKNGTPREEFAKLAAPIPSKRETPKIKKKSEVSPKFQRLLSIDINDDIPLKEVYLDLCKQAQIGCEISNKFEDTRVHFSAHDKPFIEIFEDLSSLTHKKITIMKDKIRIEEDHPYLVNYNLQFLTGIRKTQNKVSTATQVLSGGQNDKNTLDNGSNSIISAQNSIDFWKELDFAIKTILTHMPNHQPLLDNDDEDLNDKKHSTPEQQKYAFHKQAGLLSVVATFWQHKAISSYIDQLRKAATSQVLIEAKIIEVALSKKYSAGINWDFLLSRIPGQSIQTSMNTSIKKDAFVVRYADGSDIGGFLNLMEEFGTTKTLSSPRLTVMNNQNAVLKIGENRVFFRLRYNQVRLDPITNPRGLQSDMITANSEIQTVPIGITLSVQPSIDTERGEITLSIRPTITNSHKNVEDPAVKIVAKDSGIESVIPVIEVREFDSVLTMKSGQVAIMGGLMQEKSKDQTIGLPETSGSFLENILGSTVSERELTELVVILKATILENPDPDTKDVDVYQNSIHDNRPWRP